MIRSCLIFGFFTFFYINYAHAYIDPGIGALFLQGFIAIVAGVSLFFSRVRQIISKILGVKERDGKEKDKKDINNNKK